MLKLVKCIRDNLSGSAQFSPAMVQCRQNPYICIVPGESQSQSSFGPLQSYYHMLTLLIVKFIPESYNLYGIIVKIMQKLYSSLPPDTLDGHNTRFKDLYRQLNRWGFYTKYFNSKYHTSEVTQIKIIHYTFCLAEVGRTSALLNNIPQVLCGL